MGPLMRVIQKIQDEGLGTLISRRLRWYENLLKVNNRRVGAIVEFAGDKVRMDGLVYSVKCPLISTRHKSTLFFGLHEIEERALVRRHVPATIPVIEFGGGLGVISCLTNSILRNKSDHIVVEANPQMIPILEENRRRNKAGFKVVNRALAYGADRVELAIDDEFVGSSLHGKDGRRTMSVETTTLAHVLSDLGFAEVGIICDIEGLESDLIQREILSDTRVRYLLAEMHPRILGAEHVRHLMSRLLESGFDLEEKMGDVVFFLRS